MVISTFMHKVIFRPLISGGGPEGESQALFKNNIWPTYHVVLLKFWYARGWLAMYSVVSKPGGSQVTLISSGS